MRAFGILWISAMLLLAMRVAQATPPNPIHKSGVENSICVNGIIEDAEQCDDNNNVNGDGCPSNCRLIQCGDGAKEPAEDCDDGSIANATDGCGGEFCEVTSGWTCVPSNPGIPSSTSQCTPNNTAPVAVDDTSTTPEDTPNGILKTTLTANDTDAQNDALTVVSALNPIGGTVMMNATHVTFDPSANFNGTGGFDYVISDGTLTDTGHVSVTVTAVNDAPVAVDDTATTAEDVVLNINTATLLVNDTDTDGPSLSVTAVSGATNGTVGMAGNIISFTPSPDFNGVAGFDYTVSDGLLPDGGHVTITVTAVNDAPLAVDDTTTSAEDVVLNINTASLLANDIDSDGPGLSVTAVSNATNGAVVLAGNAITFTPAANFNGTAGFDYNVSDGTLFDTGHVNVTVTAVNDEPTLTVTGENPTFTEDGPAVDLFSGVTASTVEVGQTLTRLDFTVTNVTDGVAEQIVVDGTTIQLVTGSGLTASNGLSYTVTVVSGTATLSLTRAAGISLVQMQTLIDGMTYENTSADPAVANRVVTLRRLDDNGSNTAPNDNTATLALTSTVAVTAVNDVPVANNNAISVNENSGANPITLTGSDVEGDSLSFSVASGPTNGTLSLISLTGPTTANISYTPNANFAGSDAFTFTVNDGVSTSMLATVGITVVNVPVCNDLVVEAPETCDDGNLLGGDGCNATCAIENGWTCPPLGGTCSSICGDGLIVGTEQCDDNNVLDNDTCTSQCVNARACNTTAVPGGASYSQDPATGTCYVNFTGSTNWSDAQTACVGNNGYLMTITNAGEQSRLKNNLLLGIPWIGGSDQAIEGSFDWVTTESFGPFTSFAAGEPDDDVGLGGNGDCLVAVDANANWGDTTCSFVGFANSRVCELPFNTCGDGIIHAANGEACDDGNQSAGDGCSATCAVENGAVCSGSPTTCAKLVINEVDYDQAGSDTIEFVEILNVGTAAVDVSNLRLVLMNGSAVPGVEYFFDASTGAANASKRVSLASAGVPSNLLAPTQMIVIGQAAVVTPPGVFRINITAPAAGWMQNGATDAIGLFDFSVPTAPILKDVVSYEGSLTSGGIAGVAGTFSFVEGSGHPTGDTAVGVTQESLSRIPNGKDSENNSTDFTLRPSTPGTAN